MVTSWETERPADYLTRLASSQLGRAYKSLVVEELRIEPDAPVVDLGCGAEPDWDTLIIDFREPATPVAYRRFITERVVRNARVGRAIPDLCERSLPSIATWQKPTASSASSE